MRKQYCLFPLLLFFLFLGGCGSVQEKPEMLNVIFQYDANFWSSYDLSNSSIPTQEHFEKLVLQYISEIEERTGAYNWWKAYNPEADTLVLHLDIHGDMSRTELLTNTLDNEVEARITLSRKYLTLTRFDASLAHELTHLMCHTFSQSLEEGLCCYIDEEIGANDFYRQLGWDVQEVYKLSCRFYAEHHNISNEEITEIISLVGKSGYGYPYSEFNTASSLNSPKSSLWFDYSTSFVRYLMEHYDLEFMTNLIRFGEDESSYQKYFHKTLDELKEEWISYMDALEPVHTSEELRKEDEAFYLK